ncbi:esterase B1-like [Teleopsis dalmanni]|uniref:esterase B1-like n=1 Tax=Teleopsis dalmanni TaxID=139649 RepID=UPI0018CF3754|nr:esterase B1-like [Teleopsis dalmanni]
MNPNITFLEKLRWRFNTIEHKFLQYRHTTNETVIAETEYGKIKGVKRITIYDEPYYSFEGIPYAQPPVGELRFKAPQRPIPWTDVKDCTNAKDKSVQVNFVYNKVEGTEDCLYLNIYTNNLHPEKPRPVMIWIHGGGFIMGEANRDWYGPDYFMKQDVILVTIQYRLGALGFLSLNTPELNVPGNAGLKDQVLALKWVKNNCTNFGGNPDCITVFGESAGGASTHYMMLTEQTQGLFHRAILMSGNAYACWAYRDSCTKGAFTLAKLAGYKGENNEKDVLQFLLKAKSRDLIGLKENVSSLEERQESISFAFGPTLEPYISADCVIPNHPRVMAKTAWSNAIPIMLGNTSYEGLLWTPEVQNLPMVIKDLETCVNLVPTELIAIDRTTDEVKEKGLIIKKAHVTGETPTADNYLDLCSYRYMWFPSHRLIQSRFAHAASAPMYLYRFDFDSEEIINPYRIFRRGHGVKGVSHADELTYIFWNLLAHRLPKDSPSYRTIERTIGIWTQFAITGNPNNDNISGLDTETWEPLKKSDKIYKCLNINDQLKFVDLPEMEKLKLWESLFINSKELFY